MTFQYTNLSLVAGGFFGILILLAMIRFAINEYFVQKRKHMHEMLSNTEITDDENEKGESFK